MKHTVVICITVLLVAFGGGYLAQQELKLQTNIAESTFARDHAYYDLEQSKFKFDMLRFSVLLKQASTETVEPDAHASPPPSPNPPNLRADNN